MGRGMTLAVAGMAAGFGAAWMLRRLIESLLFETRIFDLFTLAIVSVVLMVCAAGACWAPSRRASRLDPVTCLRQE
jgi:ABC-type lipoprotein release transport system permease subunit